MIEPTDEMADAVDEIWVGGGSASQAVTAVLAIVERDYRTEPKPPWERNPDVWLCCIGYVPCQGRPGCNAATS